MCKGEVCDVDFVNYWLKDKSRKVFERAVFKPPPIICYENEFNTFTGFCYEQWDNTNVDVNPDNYNMSGNQVIPSAVHDARWIENDGRPNGGFLQIFNNSGVSNSQSAIDGISTPWDATTGSYLRTTGQSFGPSNYTTRYECAYSAPGQSASDRMSNGNIFVNASGGQGGAGVMYEIDSLENIVWGPYNAQSPKGFRYECDYPGIIALESYMNSETSSCFNSTSVESVNKEGLSVYPNPTNSDVTIEFESSINSNIKIGVYNTLGQEVFSQQINSLLGQFKQEIDLKYFSEGIYIVNVISENGKLFTKRISYIK